MTGNSAGGTGWQRARAGGRRTRRGQDSPLLGKARVSVPDHTLLTALTRLAVEDRKLKEFYYQLIQAYADARWSSRRIDTLHRAWEDRRRAEAELRMATQALRAALRDQSDDVAARRAEVDQRLGAYGTVLVELHRLLDSCIKAFFRHVQAEVKETLRGGIAANHETYARALMAAKSSLFVIGGILAALGPLGWPFAVVALGLGVATKIYDQVSVEVFAHQDLKKAHQQSGGDQDKVADLYGHRYVARLGGAPAELTEAVKDTGTAVLGGKAAKTFLGRAEHLGMLGQGDVAHGVAQAGATFGQVMHAAGPALSGLALSLAMFNAGPKDLVRTMPKEQYLAARRALLLGRQQVGDRSVSDTELIYQEQLPGGWHRILVSGEEYHVHLDSERAIPADQGRKLAVFYQVAARFQQVQASRRQEEPSAGTGSDRRLFRLDMWLGDPPTLDGTLPDGRFLTHGYAWATEVGVPLPVQIAIRADGSGSLYQPTLTEFLSESYQREHAAEAFQRLDAFRTVPATPTRKQPSAGPDGAVETFPAYLPAAPAYLPQIRDFALPEEIAVLDRAIEHGYVRVSGDGNLAYSPDVRLGGDGKAVDFDSTFTADEVRAVAVIVQHFPSPGDRA